MRAAFRPNPFFYIEGTRSGAEGPRRCSAQAHTLRHHPGIVIRGRIRRWTGQRGPTSGSPFRGIPPVDPTYRIQTEGTPEVPSSAPTSVRVDPHAPAQAISGPNHPVPARNHPCPNSVLVLLVRLSPPGFTQGAAGSVPAGGPPRLLPSPRRPPSKRGCGTARRWYTAGLSHPPILLSSCFSLFLRTRAGSGLGPRGIGAMI